MRLLRALVLGLASGLAAAAVAQPLGGLGSRELLEPQDAFRLPITGTDLVRERVRLKGVSQGCSDSGVCYIPQEQWVEVGLGVGSRSLLR